MQSKKVVNQIFSVQLPSVEDNPVETIKRISDEQMKMPELLIESINERAL